MEILPRRKKVSEIKSYKYILADSHIQYLHLCPYVIIKFIVLAFKQRIITNKSSAEALKKLYFKKKCQNADLERKQLLMKLLYAKREHILKMEILKNAIKEKKGYDYVISPIDKQTKDVMTAITLACLILLTNNVNPTL